MHKDRRRGGATIARAGVYTANCRSDGRLHAPAPVVGDPGAEPGASLKTHVARRRQEQAAEGHACTKLYAYASQCGAGRDALADGARGRLVAACRCSTVIGKGVMSCAGCGSWSEIRPVVVAR